MIRRLGTREESWVAVLNNVIRVGVLGQTMEGGGGVGQVVSGKENIECKDARARAGEDKRKGGTGGWPMALEAAEGLWLLLWRPTGRFGQ